MEKPKILISSPWGNYPKVKMDLDPIDYFYYRNTYRQKMFQLRSHQSWHSLHFIAQNLPLHSVVLENPKEKAFRNEILSGKYNIVAIGFTVLLSSKVLEMTKWIKENRPEIFIVLGGYGTAIFKDNLEISEKLRSYVDSICFGDGILFFRELLKEKWNVDSLSPLRQDLLPATNCFFRTKILLFKQIIAVGGLGCTYGCSFCATSSQFNRSYHSLFGGKELVNILVEQSRKYPDVQSAIIYEEDFLHNRAKALEFMHCFEKSELASKPFLITVFASAHSILNFTMEELICCGIGTIFIGVESLSEEILSAEQLFKRKGDIEVLFANLHKHGINTLGSLILGWDEQNPEVLQNDIRRFVSLNPTFYQVVPLHLVPGTLLWEKMRKEGRIPSNYNVDTDGIHKVNFTPCHSSEKIISELALSTYIQLVNEGGAWPFRMLENLTNGYLNLKNNDNPVHSKRAAIYRKMIPPVLLLASASRFMFFGKGFGKRWARTYKYLFNEFPLLTITSIILAPAIAFILGFIYLISNLFFWINPNAGQPERTRQEYYP